MEEATFVIVGGGIAGVTCAETLAFLEPDQPIILVSESRLIKTVTNLIAITRTLAHFDIEENDFTMLNDKYGNIKVIHDSLLEIDDLQHFIVTKTRKIKYKMLCLCTGAEPELIPEAEKFPQILGIRDTDSVENLVSKLSNSKRIVVVGNGGIASELIYKIENIEVEWVVKDKHISATFVDPGAAEFFQPGILAEKHTKTGPVVTRMRFNEESACRSGAALGPAWYKDLKVIGSGSSTVKIHYQTEIATVKTSTDPNYSLEVTLNNNDVIYCDLLISATGVKPRVNFKTQSTLELSEDGGIQVNQYLQTSISHVYAAGDCCNANWELAKHWFQMKLWTQARQMGAQAAKSMAGHYNDEQVLQDFCFEMFSHSTELFGFKVTLLGLFNGQKLGNSYEILLRITKGNEYIKLVLVNHKLQGAVLIGDTDLDEMCENLILNQLDLEPYGDDILNPDIDIEDYFD